MKQFFGSLIGAMLGVVLGECLAKLLEQAVKSIFKIIRENFIEDNEKKGNRNQNCVEPKRPEKVPMGFHAA